MADDEPDKTDEILRERYDWIKLVDYLRKRYPSYPQDVLVRLVVRFDGKRGVIEQVLSSQLEEIGHAPYVMTQSATNHRNVLPNGYCFESEVGKVHQPIPQNTLHGLPYFPTGMSNPTIPSSNMNSRTRMPTYVGTPSGPSDSQMRLRYDITERSANGFPSFSCESPSGERYSTPHPSGVGGSNNLDKEHGGEAFRQPSCDIKQLAPETSSLHSVGNTNLPNIGNALSVQRMKYNRMKKKVEGIRVEIERVRAHVAQEEEELNAKATIAKNPTFKELGRLKEENEDLRQELLLMLKELDDFGEPFGDEKITPQNITGPVTCVNSFPSMSTTMVTTAGESLLRSYNRPASRFPYPAVTSVSPTPTPTRSCFPSMRPPLLRASPPSYEHALSYPPVRDDPPPYSRASRQTSFPSASVNFTNVDFDEVEARDNADRDGKWSCLHCTYDNHAAIRNCEICEKPRE